MGRTDNIPLHKMVYTSQPYTWFRSWMAFLQSVYKALWHDVNSSTNFKYFIVLVRNIFTNNNCSIWMVLYKYLLMFYEVHVWPTFHATAISAPSVGCPCNPSSQRSASLQMQPTSMTFVREGWEFSVTCSCWHTTDPLALYPTPETWNRCCMKLFTQVQDYINVAQ